MKTITAFVRSSMKRLWPVLVCLLAVWHFACRNKAADAGQIPTNLPVLANTIPQDSLEPPLISIPLTRPVTIADYFKFVDTLVAHYDSLVPYNLDEYLLVRANPWLIDTLENTDYYRRMAQGHFVADQRQLVVLRPGDTLRLPGPRTAETLLAAVNNTWLDINVPAFRLRIMEGDSVLYSFPCRVGKNMEKYLAVAGHPVDLRTHSGTGAIIRVVRYPVFYDPVTGDEFKFTKRDDGRTTRMPLIPWIEPAVDGIRYGQMIHPTTNPRTLGKAASNGCIGLKEADAWRVYYYAPLRTKVVIRYDLLEIGPAGDTLRYEDVYQRKKSRQKAPVQAGVLPFPKWKNECWCEP